MSSRLDKEISKGQILFFTLHTRVFSRKFKFIVFHKRVPWIRALVVLFRLFLAGLDHNRRTDALCVYRNADMGVAFTVSPAARLFLCPTCRCTDVEQFQDLGYRPTVAVGESTSFAAGRHEVHTNILVNRYAQKAFEGKRPLTFCTGHWPNESHSADRGTVSNSISSFFFSRPHACQPPSCLAKCRNTKFRWLKLIWRWPDHQVASLNSLW